ncbi:MAG: hypothetical protein WBL45_12840 [Solirubrobacterales bacterium]
MAVFLVLGGATAFAALGKNTVGTKQLKNNAVTAKKVKKNAVTAKKIKNSAVTTAKIKNSAVTTEKIKNGAVTGAKVNLATLGTVPSAAVANSLAGRSPFHLYTGPGLTTLGQFGPFTLRANCLINVGGEDEAILELLTSVDNAVMDDNSGDEFSPFNVSDNPAELISESETTGQVGFESGQGEFAAVAPDGTVIMSGEQAVGVNIAGHAGQCFFAIVINRLA